MIYCSNCHTPYPDIFAFRCPKCRGVFDYAEFPSYDPNKRDLNLPGIWKYQHAFGLPEKSPVVSLGEGDTPLSWIDVEGLQVGLKHEYENPTGSHKDRAVAVMVSFLASLGIKEAIEDSSGNAGASFAAYAQKTGIKARIYIPDYASGPKRQQIYDYGAEVIRILGRRSAAADKVLAEAEKGAIYASHAYLPHLLTGYATIAYELFHEMDQLPGTIISPVGQGSLLLGIARGFENLKSAGLIAKGPRLVGVQAMACAPLWALYTMGPAGLGWVTEGETVAEGVRARYPIRGDALIKTVADSNGFFVAVEEERILPGRDELANRGFKVEPTSAIVWDALRQLKSQLPEPVILILTGAGYKSLI